MKTSKTFLILLAAAAVSGATAIAAESDSTTADKTPPPHRQGPPPPSPEMKAYHEKVMAIYDVNKDSQLDEDERAVLRADVEAGKFPPPPRMGGGRGPGGPGGPGRMGPPPEILEKYDTNKDGKLDDAERAVLEKDIADGKLPPPRRGRGPHGPRGDDAPPPPSDAPAQ